MKTDAFEDFLSRLLHEGSVVFREAPAPLPAAGASHHALSLLTQAFERVRLDVAGPEIAFDPGAAGEAAEFVRQACWAMVCRTERVQDLGRRLVLRTSPAKASPSTHLSIDLIFRFLPQVLHRARGIDPGDALVTMIADALRAWPLSGVLADLDEAPLDPKALGFGGHPGLLLLYAERLAAHDRTGWRPEEGPGLEYFDLVAPGRVLALQGRDVGIAEDSVDD